MSEERVQRRLAAILAADVVGYSRLMGTDETGTRDRFNTHLNELIEPAIARYGGRVVKTMGDGLLVEFASVVDAVQCAVQIQKSMADRNADEPDDRRIEFRIGVNLGDVIIEGDDIHGDGVNVAARLEALADPGSVVVSGTVHEHVRGKLDFGFDDLGPQDVKNIAQPVPAYRVLPEGRQAVEPARKMASSRWRFPAIAAAVLVLIAAGGVAWWQLWKPDVEPASIDKMVFKLPDKPSIAVLPFTNMSGDKEQEYFADGISEDIITDLSKVSGLFVVARNSTFTYKGKAVKVRQVAEDLGVRYVLEGSVRRSGNRVRINVQLIDAVRGGHLWAERYERELKDVFAVQTDVTRRVIKELAVTLKANEQERLFRKHTQNVEAYDLFLRARRAWVPPTKERILRAKRLLERVIEIDPHFAAGYAGLSFMHSSGVRQGYSESRESDIEKALELAHKAIATDDTFGWSYLALGSAYLMNGEHDNAIAAMRNAVRIQPSDADAYAYLGYYLHWAGRGEEAIEANKTALRLNPKPRGARNVAFLGYAYFTAGRYEDAIDTINQRYEWFAARAGPPVLGYLAAAYAATGQDDKARVTMDTFLDKRPKLTISTFPRLRIYKRAEDRERLIKLLRKAGIPEK